MFAIQEEHTEPLPSEWRPSYVQHTIGRHTRRRTYMDFNLEHGIAVLKRTPATLNALLRALPDAWIYGNEGEDTWSPFDIVGHLIHGEKTDWIPRAQIILTHGDARPFDPFDRFAQFDQSKEKRLHELLDEFDGLRAQNLNTLRGWDLQPADFALTGRHPDLGIVTLGQLLACWVVHDLSHIRQAARVMARQYTGQVGPWNAYLPVLGA
ncbi:MAG: DinB family protein [Rhodothermales bacterium]